MENFAGLFPFYFDNPIEKQYVEILEVQIRM